MVVFKIKDEEEKSVFEAILQAFTDKKVIRLLSEKEEITYLERYCSKYRMKGYNMGGQDEIIYDENGIFMIELVDETIQSGYIVVMLI